MEPKEKNRPEFIRYIQTLLVPQYESKLTEIISSYLDTIDHLCLRHLGLKTPAGRILSNGAAGCRTRLPLEGSGVFICTRPPGTCDCRCTEEYYVEQRPSILNMYKLFAIKTVSVPHGRMITDRYGKEKWERYNVDEILPTLTVFIEPHFKRGENHPKTLTDDYVATEQELWETKDRTMTLIDVESGELLVKDIKLHCTGHNPVGGQECKKNIIRMEIQVHPLFSSSWVTTSTRLQCQDCDTDKLSICKKDNVVHSQFEQMNWEKQIFGLNRVTEGIQGPRFISIA